MRQRMKRTAAILFAALLLPAVLWFPVASGYYNFAAGGHVCGILEKYRSASRCFRRDPAL